MLFMPAMVVIYFFLAGLYVFACVDNVDIVS